jgi:hypothetical protein
MEPGLLKMGLGMAIALFMLAVAYLPKWCASHVQVSASRSRLRCDSCRMSKEQTFRSSQWFINLQFQSSILRNWSAFADLRVLAGKLRRLLAFGRRRSRGPSAASNSRLSPCGSVGTRVQLLNICVTAYGCPTGVLVMCAVSPATCAYTPCDRCISVVDRPGADAGNMQLFASGKVANSRRCNSGSGLAHIVFVSKSRLQQGARSGCCTCWSTAIKRQRQVHT